MTTTPTVRDAALAKREDPPAVATAKKYRDQFSEILPEHVESKGFVGAAVSLLRKDPALAEAANNSPTMFLNALMECARLGHVPGGKEFYFTQRRSKDHDNKSVIVGMEGYRGVIERMYRSGAVTSVVVREVVEGDYFRYREGADATPVHEADWFNPDRSDPAKIIGGYAYARLSTGAVSRVVVMSRKDFEDTRQRSDAGSDRGKGSSGPWVTDYRAMCWKTLAHRLEPWVPTSAEYRREQARALAAADNLRREEAPAGVDVETGEIHDAIVVDD